MDKTSPKYYKIRQYFVFQWSEDCLPGRRKKGELQKELQLLAERSMTMANAQIGVAEAAFYW